MSLKLLNLEHLKVI